MGLLVKEESIMDDFGIGDLFVLIVLSPLAGLAPLLLLALVNIVL